jgi:hypothetical protein
MPPSQNSVSLKPGNPADVSGYFAAELCKDAGMDWRSGRNFPLPPPGHFVPGVVAGQPIERAGRNHRELRHNGRIAAIICWLEGLMTQLSK